MAAHLEQRWLEDDGGGGGVKDAAARKARGGSSIVIGTENPYDQWLSTASLSANGSLQTSLLRGESTGGGGDEAKMIGWALRWRDAPRRGKSATSYAAYARVRMLGRGAHGTVVLLRDPKTGECVVCKETPLDAVDAARLEQLQNEVRILASVQHDHVISYFCSAPRPEERLLCVFMEYAEGGTLADLISAHTQRTDPIAEALVRRWTAQLAGALAHLHCHRILHRDMKTANVLLTLHQAVKLIDFGASRRMSPHTQLVDTVVGTPHYMAPEVIRAEPYAEPADVWGLGVIVYELCALRRPYMAGSLAALLHCITHQPLEVAPLAASRHPRDLWGLAASDALLHTDPARRMTLDMLTQRLAALDAARPLTLPPSTLPPPSPLPSGPGDSSHEDASMLSIEPPSPLAGLCSVPLGQGTPSCDLVSSSATPEDDRSLRSRSWAEIPACASAAATSTAATPAAATAAAAAAAAAAASAAASPHAAAATTSAHRAHPHLSPPYNAEEAEAQRVRSGLTAGVGALIPSERLVVDGLLGRGGFASVYRGRLLPSPAASGGDARAASGVAVAVKRIAPYPAAGTKDFTRLVREIALMRTLSHPNVLPLLGISVASGALSLVLELMPRGSIYDWLHHECRGVAPPPPIAVRLLLDTAAGLAHLHSRSPRIAHRDVKTLNLLLAADHTVKVADFGLSREFARTQSMSRVGTIQYVAPEVLLGQPYSHKCDVWSFGIVVWELCTALIPFDGLASDAVARKVALEGLRLPPPPRAPPPLLVMMAACWAAPARRPEFSRVQRQLQALLSELRAEPPPPVGVLRFARS